MNIIKEILTALGTTVDQMKINESYTLSVDSNSIMDLTIEKVGPERLSVAHYRKQRGDLMRDPEIVFDVGEESWTAVEFQQDPGMYQANEDGLAISDFESTWGSNLRQQGFLDAAEQMES